MEDYTQEAKQRVMMIDKKINENTQKIETFEQKVTHIEPNRQNRSIDIGPPLALAGDEDIEDLEKQNQKKKRKKCMKFFFFFLYKR